MAGVWTKNTELSLCASTAMPTEPVSDRAEFRYHVLRAATERFQTAVADLSPVQAAEVTRLARRTFELESLVLGSPEARDLLVLPERVAAAVAELRGRYGDEADFAADLERNGLDLDALSRALHRELTFDGVMQSVASRHAAVDELEERLFYDFHRERFTVPERRTARHLLITVNADYVENRRDAARARIERLADQLRGGAGSQVQRFEAAARKHSECPTALEGGRLGEVVPGQLYPALEAVLFSLGSGEIGGPVESELGFHLLLCERIEPQRSIPFAQAQPQVRQVLEERGRRNCQKAWIKQLRQQAGAVTGETTVAEQAA